MSPNAFNAAAATQTPGPQELTDAVIAKDVAKAKELLQRGANPNEMRPRGTVLNIPPLIEAIISCCGTDMISLLIDSGADVNLARENGFTALIQAVYNARPPEVISLLIEKEAAPDIKSNEGLTALDYARSYNWEIAEILQGVVAEKAQAKIEERTAKEESARHALVAGKQELLQERAKKIKLKPAPAVGKPSCR